MRKDIVEILKNCNIYENMLNLFTKSKNDDKLKNILAFLTFLFENDTQDVAKIVKIVYDKIGLSEIFLEWGVKVVKLAIGFFVDFLADFSNLKPL